MVCTCHLILCFFRGEAYKMKTLIIIASLLGVLLTQSLADDNVNIGNKGNIGSNVHQTVNINNQNNVANVNNLNGWDSWDSVCDYGRGLFATRLFGKKICVVSKMNKAVFPSLAELSKVTQQEQPSTTPRLFKYSPNQVPIANIGVYGVHIEALCKGIPSYTVEEVQDTDFFPDICHTGSIITIGGISFCY
ncbi:gastrokine-1-like [Ascaphus truei]|uniref:gastrokine-1-like n=1 Tax=Ascaphus truei TaxID=8439 RepID=UPI003F5A59EB